MGITAHDDVTWALMGYLGQFAIGFIAPLVVYLARKDRSPFVRFHGAQALNLTLTYTIGTFATLLFVVIGGTSGLGAYVLVFGVPLFLAFAVVHVVFLIIASIRANRREAYRIPAIACWPMIR